MKRVLARFSAAALALGMIAGAGSPQRGTFALQTGAAQTQGFLRAVAESDRLDQDVEIWMTPANARGAIRSYAVDMTQLLHVIIVSDDLKQFLHVHPVLGADGHFRMTQRFPVAALYHVYADGEPQGIGQQVFRFDLPVAGGRAVPERTLRRTGRSVQAGPYTVTLSGTSLHAGREAALAVHVLRDGKPAGDLHPYLGALAHAVFLDATDLTYVHVHPMPIRSGRMDSMPGMSMPNMPGMKMPGMEMKPLPGSAVSAPDMLLQVALREQGTYKLWLQFRGGKALYVAPFVITVK